MGGKAHKSRENEGFNFGFKSHLPQSETLDFKGFFYFTGRTDRRLCGCFIRKEIKRNEISRRITVI